MKKLSQILFILTVLSFAWLGISPNQSMGQGMILSQKTNGRLKILSGYKHFNSEAGIRKLSEVLEEITKN